MADFKSKNIKKILEQLENNFRVISNTNNIRHLVISDERPTSVFGFDTEIILSHLTKILDQLENVTVDKIVLTTREPSSWIVSHMAYHYLNWWTLGVDSPAKLIREFMSGNQFAKFIFSYECEMIKLFNKHFDGVPFVKISYEQLNNDSILWAKEIKKNLGLAIKISEVNRNKIGNFWPVNGQHLFRRGIKRSLIKTLSRIIFNSLSKKNIFRSSRSFGSEDVLCIEKFMNLLKVGKLIIVGSGSNHEIKSCSPGIVFINTSFVRMSKYKNAELSTLFLADSYFNLSLIKNAPATQKLKKIRSDKIKALKGVTVSNIFTISTMSSSKIKKGLDILQIKHTNIIIISPRNFYWLLLSQFGLRSFKAVDLIFYFKAIILNKKPKPSLRPSNGVCAAIVFSSLFKSKERIGLNGILSDSSFYGSSMDQYNIYNVHKTIDTFLIKQMLDRFLEK